MMTILGVPGERLRLRLAPLADPNINLIERPTGQSEPQCKLMQEIWVPPLAQGALGRRSDQVAAMARLGID